MSDDTVSRGRYKAARLHWVAAAAERDRLQTIIDDLVWKTPCPNMADCDNGACYVREPQYCWKRHLWEEARWPKGC